MTSNQYFDDLFEKLVNIHERLDTASTNSEKVDIVSDLNAIQVQGNDIYKQWLILKEYIDILNQEYNLAIPMQQDDLIFAEDTASSDQEEQTNTQKDHTNQVFWIADEESITTFRKGIGYFELLMYENSLEYFKETVEKNPDFMMGRVYLGLSYLSLGKLHEAESELKKSLLFSEDGSPYIPLANHTLACVYAQLKKYELSKKYFQKVLENNTDFNNIHFNLGASFYNQQNYKHAKSLFAEGIERNRNDWELYFLSGKCDMFLMCFEQAVENLKIAFRLSNRIDVGLTLGKVYEITNNTHLAFVLYNQLLELYPKESELHHRIGWIHLYNNANEKAITSIKRAIVLSPRNESYIFTLGWMYLQTNNNEQAKKCFAFIEKHCQKSVLPNIGLAKLFSNIQKYNLAKEYLKNAIRNNKTKHELGVITYHLGYYWLQRKQYIKSLHSFNASLKYAPYLTESNFYKKVLGKIIDIKINL